MSTEPTPCIKNPNPETQPSGGSAFATLMAQSDFRAACQEILAMGVDLSAEPGSGKQQCVVLSARSNSRWWIAPSSPGRVAAASLGLFQPVLRSARIAKWGAVFAARIGGWHLFARNRVYVSGNNKLISVFGPSASHFAYFTGTAGPHRKVVAQAMDRCGNILGYAKMSLNPNVSKIIGREAKMLGLLQKAGLESFEVPSVLSYCKQGGAIVLATDTRKTRHAKLLVDFCNMHVAFLREMAKRFPNSSLEPNSWDTLRSMRSGFEEVFDHMTPAWRERLTRALDALEQAPRLITSLGLSHGDFTPWNSFANEGRLYVFDWEYAGYDYPADYDFIHFILATPSNMRRSPVNRCVAVLKVLQRFGRRHQDAQARLLAYATCRSIRYATRELRATNQTFSWAGEPDAANIIDRLLRDLA